MSSNRRLPWRNAEISDRKLATISEGGRERYVFSISINRDIPYSSSLLLRASGTPSVYKRRVYPALSFKVSTENFSFGNMASGRPVARIDSICPPRLNRAGGWPALQIETSPSFDARPQISVAY